MADYKWRPIEPLTDRDKAIDLAAIRPLYDSGNSEFLVGRDEAVRCA